MAAPTVAVTLSDGTRTVLSLEAAQGELFEARLARLGAVLGRDFAADALRIDADRPGHRLTGYAGLPTLHRRTRAHQRAEGHTTETQSLMRITYAILSFTNKNDQHS